VTLLSFVLFRRRLYEFFLQVHAIASIALLVFLWLHIRGLNTYVLVCLSTAAFLFVLQKILWTIHCLYRNIGSGPRCQASVTRYSSDNHNEEVYQVRVDIKRPWNVVPGQFVYLSLPRARSLGLGLFESHPFMVVWAIENEGGQLKSIVLLVRSCRGFTRRLRLAQAKTTAIIDGPYGGTEAHELANYDKILLMSSGVGIAAHLHMTRYLLLAHNRQTARVRRLTVLWFLETSGSWYLQFSL
jgi:predicted ferric reductase